MSNKDKFTDYDSTAANNTNVGGVNLAENSALPSDLNNAVREVMSHIKDALGSGTPLYVDQTNDRLGIGTTSPDRDLHVEQSGHAKIKVESTGTNASIEIQADSGGDNKGHFRISGDPTSSGGLFIYDETNSAERLRISTDGEIGIGVTANNTGGAGDINMKGNHAIRWMHATNGTQYGDIYVDTSNNIVLRNTDSSTERMRIDSSGNVGIGTASPSSVLHVRNNTPVLILDDANNGTGGTSYRPAVKFFANGTEVGNIGMRYNDDLTIEASNYNSAAIRFYTGNLERMRIGSGGNINMYQPVVIDSNSYFKGNTSHGYRFNNAADSVNLLQIFDGGRIGYKSEGSNNIRATTDLRQGAAKCWSHVNQNGTQAINDSYNVTSISDNGTGRTTITINNDMNNDKYVVSGINRDGGGYNDNTGLHTDTNGAFNGGAYEIFCHIGSTGNDGIPMTAVHGDLA